MVRRALGLGVGAAATVTLLAGCDVGKAFSGFGWPQGGITPEANRMYDLWIGSTVAAFAVGFFVWGLIFWSIIRYRKRGNELPPQTRFNLPIEIIYSVVPFLIIAVLFYYTAIIQTDVNRQSTQPDVTVEVIAFQWNWQFNYKQDQSEDGSSPTLASTQGTSDQIPVLVVPTDQTIRFELASRDVIHSFWVPDLLFKRDVFPDAQARNAFHVTVTKEGAYVGRCAEFCGTYHSMMNFELRAVSADKFTRFMEAKQAGMSTPEALSSIGEEPYATKTVPFDTKREG